MLCQKGLKEDAVRFTLMQLSSVWCSLVQLGAVMFSLVQFDAVRVNLMQFDAVWCSLMQLDSGSDRCSLVHQFTEVSAVQCSSTVKAQFMTLTLTIPLTWRSGSQNEQSRDVRRGGLRGGGWSCQQSWWSGWCGGVEVRWLGGCASVYVPY